MPENKEVRKLELCDIAPYLPFGLNVSYGRISNHTRILGLKIIDGEMTDLEETILCQYLPILRPLDQLTQEITHGGRTFIPAKELFEMCDFEIELGMPDEIEKAKYFIENHNRNDDCYPLSFWEKLAEYHFDYKNLIPSGLAIPIHNTNNPIN